MGLDMYLLKNGKEIMYWRKANHIHKWFEDNCADGDRDKTADPVLVTIEQLKELKELLERLLVLRDEQEAETLLPTTAGFFFGSTDYSEGYWRDCEDTLKKLNEIFKEYNEVDMVFDNTKFHYFASW